MLPLITFRCSYFLQKKIIGTVNRFHEIVKFTKNFDNYFRIHEKIILNKIPEYTGFEWKRKEIPVWIIDGFLPSISFPLFLNWYEGDKKFVLFTFVHELSHTNLSNLFIIKKQNKIDNIESEAITELITKNVIKNIFDKKTVDKLCKKGEFGGIYKIVWEREKEIERIWNLNEKTLKKWIDKNDKYKIRPNWQNIIKAQDTRIF